MQPERPAVHSGTSADWRTLARAATTCLTCLLLATGGSAQDRTIGDPDLRPLLEREVGRYGATGAAIALVSADSTLVLEGYGRLVEDGSARVTRDSPFGTVRLEDVITALAASILAARGRIDLHAGIGRYAPDLPPGIAAITMAQLLSHTSGLDDAPELAPRRRPVSRVWPNATERALFTQPGAIYSPSRIGYRLARSIMAQVTGSSWEALANELVLAPAGMTHTTFDAKRAEALGAAPGNVVSLTSDRPMRMLTPTANPAPQLYASAGDLAALLRLLLRDGMRGASTAWPSNAIDALETTRAARPSSPRDSVAFTMIVTRRGGYRQLSYEDGYAGYGILVRVLPGAGIGVAILANGTRAILRATADAALDQALAMRAPAARSGTPVAGVAAAAAAEARAEPPADAALAGTWSNGDRIIVLEILEGQLHWRDGDLALPVRRDGALLEVVVPDGRVAQSFRWTRDAAGRQYLLLGDRAFSRPDR